MLEESSELNELYKLYGIAAHNANNIEYRMACLLLGPGWAEKENLDSEKVFKVYEDFSRKTLGALLKDYKRHFPLNDQDKETFKAALKVRNYLVHRFFGTYGQKMHKQEVLVAMIKELKGLIIQLQSLSHLLAAKN